MASSCAILRQMNACYSPLFVFSFVLSPDLPASVLSQTRSVGALTAYFKPVSRRRPLAELIGIMILTGALTDSDERETYICPLCIIGGVALGLPLISSASGSISSQITLHNGDRHLRSLPNRNRVAILQ